MDPNRDEESQEEKPVDPRYVFLGLDCSNLLGSEAKELLEGLHAYQMKEAVKDQFRFQNYLNDLEKNPFEIPGEDAIYHFKTKTERDLQVVSSFNVYFYNNDCNSYYKRCTYH